MNTNNPMTQEQLDAIEVRLGCDTPTTEDVSTLITEVERLRALPTVDKAMVERGARALYDHDTPEGCSWDNESETVWDVYRRITRVVLDAALNPGEGA